MRKDGKRVRNLDPYFEIVPYIMNKRVDAQNMFHADIPLEPIDSFIKAKRVEGKYVSHLGMLIAAYIRMASQNPQINRFVVNKKIYARNHFCVSFVVLKKNTVTGETAPTVVKAHFNLDETVYEVSEKIADIIKKNSKTDYQNPMDKLLKAIFRMPALVTFAVGVFKLLDRYGLLPRSVLEGSPFHTSLFVTNMASLKTNYIYHHVYEFGTTTVFIAMGKGIKRLEMVDGEAKEVKYMPIGVVTDERMADGHYYSRCFREIEKYLKHPELLGTPPEKVKREIEWK